MNDLMIKTYVMGVSGISKFRDFFKDQRGVTAVEYAIVMAGVAAVVAVVFGKDGTVKELITGIFKTVSTQVKSTLPK